MEDRKMGVATKPQDPPPGDSLPDPHSLLYTDWFLSFPKQRHQAGVATHEPVGDILHSNHHISKPQFNLPLAVPDTESFSELAAYRCLEKRQGQPRVSAILSSWK